jgi:hypothetical protein
VRRQRIVWVLATLGVVLAAVLLLRLPPPRSGGFSDDGPSRFPAGLAPLFLAILAVPVVLSFLDRRRPPLRPRVGTAVGICVSVVCVALAYGTLALMFIPEVALLPTSLKVLTATAWLTGPLTPLVVLLFATVLYGVEQTGRRSQARLAAALLAALVLLSAGMLWRSRLWEYYWYTGFFQHTWVEWLCRVPLAGCLLLVVAVNAALARLRGGSARRAQGLRVVALLLAAVAVGRPYHQPSTWRADELEEIGFATVTPREELLVVASRHDDRTGWPGPGVLLRRRPGESAFECLTRRAVEQPRFSNTFGSFAVLELATPWGAVVGPGSRLRIGAVDGSCSRTGSTFELQGYALGNVGPVPFLVLGPGCSWAFGTQGLEDNGVIRPAAGDRVELDVPPCSHRWVTGNRLAVLVQPCPTGPEPCPCCTDRGKLIIVDMLSGAVVRRDLTYPRRARSAHQFDESSGKFSVHAAESNAAWLCDLEGNFEPIGAVECDEAVQPYGCTPLLWGADGSARPLDEDAFRAAVRALGLSDRWLRLSARQLGGRVIVVQGFKGDGLNVYDFDAKAKSLVPIGQRLMSVEATADSLVLVAAEATTRQVVRFWPATGRREILLTSPSQFQPFRHSYD